MLRHLIIKEIPNNEGALQRVLNEIGDFSWSREAIAAFTLSEQTTIFYAKELECYIWSIEGKLPKDITLVHKTYNQLMRG